MVQTRLLDLDSLELKTFKIGHLPPYVAISHVWSENLFPVSVVDDPARAKGLQLLQKAALWELSGTRLIWIDTWSIRQHDSRDKYRQIPQMGVIFETAEAVVAVTTHVFSFAQREWNSLAFDMNAKLQILTTSSKDVLKTRQHYDPLVPLLSKAAAIFLEIARLRWFNRIWTAQEFLLARSIAWVGGNGVPLRIRPIDMVHSLTCILNDGRRSNPLSGDWISEKIKLEALESICQLRLGLCDSTRAMQLAEFREAAVLDDEIYGLMSAARVVIYPPLDHSLSPAHIRQIWWTRAIREVHLRWALLPVWSSQSMTLQANPGPKQSSVWNCAMPVFGDHTQASRKSTIDSVSTIGKVDVTAGTISAVGRLVGTTFLHVYLGKCDLSELDKLRIIAVAGFNTSIAVKFWSAWTANHVTTADTINPTIDTVYRSTFGKRSDEQEIRKLLLASFDN